MALNGKYYESEYEEAVVALLRAAGWQYTHGEQLANRRVDDALIADDLRRFIAGRYSSRQLTEDETEAIIARLRNTGGTTDYEATYNAVALYRDGFDYVYPDGRAAAFHFDYIDFNTPVNNIYRVVNQLEMHQGPEVRRPDIMLYINGIPVAIMELKNPTDESATIRDAHTQITVRYRRDIMNLLKYCSLAVISDGSNTRLGNVYASYEFFYAWKKVSNEDAASSGVEELSTMISGALAPRRITEILRDYVYFPDRGHAMRQSAHGRPTQIVCRYPQFFATRRLRDNIVAHLRSHGGDGKGGTYFGATGCGKTYTMLFLARQLALRCKSRLGSPTVLIIVDREDLENQTSKLFKNSASFLSNGDVRTFDSRDDLAQELANRQQGGVYITTIQKFSSDTGLLSDRSNIICISDEAHRTQNNTGSRLKIVDRRSDSDIAANEEESNAKLGAFVTYGFAKYLRDALPNATYVGFTGTPIDETIHVFGGIVDSYTMRQARQDDITVDISYEPRLVHVNLDEEQSNKIEQYYKLCETEGATSEDVDRSKRAMSGLNVILGNPDRLDRMARDIVEYYDKRIDDQPDLLQKAMIVCSDRTIAVNLYHAILRYRPRWGERVKALDTSKYSSEELDKMEPVAFLNVVATRDKNDDPQMYALLGDKDHRKRMDRLFKDERSNFHIVIVVDMWITGFDVPCLNMLFNDKPLQKHTLIQTISRVNRKYSSIVLDDDGNRLSGDVKQNGIIIDYLGIHTNLQKAVKQYGGNEPAEVGNVETAMLVLRDELKKLKQIMNGYDFAPFFGQNALARLQCLQGAVEFLLQQEENGVKYTGLKPTTAFKGHVKRLKAAYNICNPAGVLDEAEVAWAQLMMGIYSYLVKITDSHHDVESMNRHVQRMVEEALSCSAVNTIFEQRGVIDIYSDDFMRELADVKLPCTKFELLVKLLRRAIKEYRMINKTRAEHFYKLLMSTIEEYHNRDHLTYVNTVTGKTIDATVGIVEDLLAKYSDKLVNIFSDLKADRLEFIKLGISFEEKAFYDILVEVRDNADPAFDYPDDRCKALAKKIKELIDKSSIYADWLNNSRVRDELAHNLTELLFDEGYPPQWDEEIFEKVLEQVENFKAYS